MRLEQALEHSRKFVYKGNKYFAVIFPRRQFWPKGRSFNVFCVDYPYCAAKFEISSWANVKPLIKPEQVKEK